MTEAFLLLIRWIHGIAAVAWVGGGIFFLVVLRPAMNAGGIPPSIRRFMGEEFGQLVALAMWALVITGGILAASLLTKPGATTLYIAVLAIKVALSAWMFFLAINRGRRGAAEAGGKGKVRSVIAALGHINMTVVLGVIIFFLSDLLRYIFEQG